jgi:hypothetical protein
VGKHSLPNPLLHMRGPSRLTTDATGFEVGDLPCAPVYGFTPSFILSLPPSLHARPYAKVLPSLPPFLGLDSFHHYARPYAKTREAWVYGGGLAQGLPCAEGFYVPRTCGRIHSVLSGIL